MLIEVSLTIHKTFYGFLEQIHLFALNQHC